MIKRFKYLLHDNRGDGYIALLIILMAGLVLFGGLYFVMDTTINLRNIRRDVDRAAEEVFSEIREVGYGQLAAGDIDNIATEARKIDTLTDTDIAGIFQAKLKGETTTNLQGPIITVKKSNGKTAYIMSNFSYTYIDGEKRSSSSFDVGDVNRDGTVNSADVTAVENWILNVGNARETLRFADVDVNADKVIDSVDKLIVESLVNEWSNFKHSSDPDYKTSTSMLVITFHMDVPMTFGDLDFGMSSDDYTYAKAMTFVPAG